jgi:hypothetical protein
VKTPPRTLLALLSLVLVAALVGSSCSSVTPQALSVNGWSLSERDFLDVLDALAEDGATSYDTRTSSSLLNAMVQLAFARQEAERRGLEVDETQRRNAEVQLSYQLSPSPGQFDGSAPDPAGQAVLDQLPSNVRNDLVDGFAALQAVGSDVLDRSATDEGLRELFDAQEDLAGDRACVSHILIQAGDGASAPTEEQYAAALAELEQVRGRLQGTANFGALAAEVSDDPGSAAAGGELGCAPQGAYVEEFDQAAWTQPLGVVSEPVRTDFGYHLILVTARGEITFEDARAQLARAVQQQGSTIVGNWLQSELRQADVSVDAKFGRWDAQAGQVLTPAAAEAAPGSGATDADLAELLGGLNAGQ